MIRNRLIRECVEQHLAPAREEEGSIIELDSHHVLGRRSLKREQAVANLPRPMPVRVSAVADPSEHGSIDDAGVGRPQSPGGWIDDLWVLFRPKPSVPAVSPIGPGSWHLTVEADPTWNPAGQRPPNPSRCIGADEILRRYPRLLRDLQRFNQGSGVLELA